MKTKLIIAALTLASGISHACIGGHQSSLVSKKGTEMAVLNKYNKTITLASGAVLTFISNCEVENPELDLQQLSTSAINIFDITDKNARICLGVEKNGETARFQISQEDYDGPIARGGCGGQISSEE